VAELSWVSTKSPESSFFVRSSPVFGARAASYGLLHLTKCKVDTMLGGYRLLSCL